MKRVAPALLPLLAPLALAAIDPASRTSPAPRPRLERAASTPPARTPATAPLPSAAATTGAAGAGAKPLMMDRVVVFDSQLPPIPRSDEPPEPKRFTPSSGGPLYSGKIGEFPLEIGLWPWRDLLAADAPFKPQRTRVDLEVVRVKF